MVKKATKAKRAGRPARATRAKGVTGRSSTSQRHRLSVVPIRQAIDQWLEKARAPKTGDPDISKAFKAIAEVKKLIPNCFAEEGGPCNEVPCPPPPPPIRRR